MNVLFLLLLLIFLLFHCSLALPYIHAKMYLNQNRFKSILTIVNFWSMFSKRKQNILQKSSREILRSLAETLGHRLIEILFFKKKINEYFINSNKD